MRIQNRSREISIENVFLHYFDHSISEKCSSNDIYLGRFSIAETIYIYVHNETTNKETTNADIPIATLVSAAVQPSILAVHTEKGDLQVQITRTRVVELEDFSTVMPAKLALTSNAYKVIRQSVIAVADSRTYLNEALHTLTGSVDIAVHGSGFILTMGYDLTKDFLNNVDMLFRESTQLLDQHGEAVGGCLLDSLSNLAHQLKQQLQEADQSLTQLIYAVLSRLQPYLRAVVRLAYPCVSLALSLSRPLRSVLYPVASPFIATAATLHARLQDSPVVGPIVSVATHKALIVLNETVDIYTSVERENSNSNKLKPI